MTQHCFPLKLAAAPLAIQDRRGEAAGPSPGGTLPSCRAHQPYAGGARPGGRASRACRRYSDSLQGAMSIQDILSVMRASVLHRSLRTGVHRGAAPRGRRQAGRDLLCRLRRPLFDQFRYELTPLFQSRLARRVTSGGSLDHGGGGHQQGLQSLVANRCEPTGRLQRVAAGFIIQTLALLSCPSSQATLQVRLKPDTTVVVKSAIAPFREVHASANAPLSHSDLLTVTTAVTGAWLVQGPQKAADSDVRSGRLLAIRP